MSDHPLQGLRQLRHEREIGRKVLASAIGVTPTSYDRYESGRRRIFLDQAQLLAKALGVSLDELVAVRTAAPSDIVVNALTLPAAPPPPAALDGWDVE